MRLTAYTYRALRTLELSALCAQALALIGDVVAIHRLKKQNDVKTLRDPEREGHFAAQRGGGFRLAKPPEAIGVEGIMRQTERDPDLVACFEPDASTCPLIGIRRLSRKLQEAAAAFLAVLDDLTIAANRGQLLARVHTGQGVAGPEARP